MPEIADVTAATTISTTWGNLIRDRTVQRYADLSTRASENPTPSDGVRACLVLSGDLDVYFDGAWRHLNGPPVGTIIDHAGGSVPPGWLVCDGSAVSRTTYAGLFSQISTLWGVGDGSTTFNVPDLRGRVARGTAASGTGDAVGETFGSDTHTHAVDPPNTSTSTTGAHTHEHDHFHRASFNTAGPSATDLGNVGSGGQFAYPEPTHVHSVNSNTQAPSDSGSDDTTSSAGNHSHTVNISSFTSGSGSTIQAGAAVNKLIKT